MHEGSTVLVVATTPSLATKLASSVRAAGHQPVLLSSFAAARRHLDEQPRPDLLISEIKLCEYNGLHLAVRGLTAGIPAIVVGDKSFERDAEQLGAICLSPSDAAGERLHAAIIRLFDLSQSRHVAYEWSTGSALPGAPESTVPATGGTDQASSVLH
jgi:DNA-binding NtrC family response regulator